MRFFKVLILVASLVGCEENQQVAGVWPGTATDAEGNVTESVMFISEYIFVNGLEKQL